MPYNDKGVFVPDYTVAEGKVRLVKESKSNKKAIIIITLVFLAAFQLSKMYFGMPVRACFDNQGWTISCLVDFVNYW